MTDTRSRRIDEIGDESRRRIMDAAESLFAEKGFDRTSFVDIAERSGISRGSIPWHFQNKDGLLVAVTERLIERSFPPDALPSLDAEGLRNVMDRVKRVVSSKTNVMMYMLLTEALSDDGRIREQYVEFFQKQRHNLAGLLAVTGGVHEPSPADIEAMGPASAVFNAAILGLGLQHHVDPDLDIDAAFEALIAMVEALSERRSQPKASAKKRS